MPAPAQPSNRFIAPTPAPVRPEEWVRAERDLPLWSGPDEKALVFTVLPQGTYLRVLERQSGRLLVHYDGEDGRAQPGIAWVDASAVQQVVSPSPWVATRRATGLWSGPDGNATLFTLLQDGQKLEVLGRSPGGRLLVRFPGDGTYRRPGVGWVQESDVRPIAPPPRGQLPWGYPANTSAEAVHLQVPYRSQLDGSLWAGANCGPASAGMILDYFGRHVETQELRDLANQIQGVYSPNTGVAIEVLQEILERYGLRGMGLMDGGELRRWTLEEVRAHLRAGHLVVPQLRYNLLPNREDYPDPDDHYVVITGYYEDSFFYNDPIDKDGIGYDRILSAKELERAWARSDFPFAAFAVTAR